MMSFNVDFNTLAICQYLSIHLSVVMLENKFLNVAYI